MVENRVSLLKNTLFMLRTDLYILKKCFHDSTFFLIATLFMLFNMNSADWRKNIVSIKTNNHDKRNNIKNEFRSMIIIFITAVRFFFPRSHYAPIVNVFVFDRWVLPPNTCSYVKHKLTVIWLLFFFFFYLNGSKQHDTSK